MGLKHRQIFTQTNKQTKNENPQSKFDRIHRNVDREPDDINNDQKTKFFSINI